MKLARTALGLAGLVACAPAAPHPERAGSERRTTLPGGVERAEAGRWIRGTVVGHDGGPLTYAGLSMGRIDQFAANTEVVLDGDGAFALMLPTDEGALVELRVDATDHAPLSLPIDTRDSDVVLAIRLGTADAPVGELKALVAGVEVEDDPWSAAFGSVGPKGMAPPAVLTRGADGVWSGSTALAGSQGLFTLMAGSESMRPAVLPSGSGPYEVLGQMVWGSPEVKDGRATVRVDMGRLPRSGVAAQVEVTGERSARLVRARLVADSWGPGDAESPPADAVTCARAAEQSRGQGPAAWVYYAGFAGARKCAIAVADAQAALRDIAVDDPEWGLAEGAVKATIAALPADEQVHGEAYATAMIGRHPSARLVGDLLLDRLRAAGDDKAKARPLVAQLRDRRFGSTLAQFYALMLDPDRIDAGKPTPEFSVPALAGGPPVTRASLLGTPHVLEFWGTWCGPCVAALPELHAEYAKLHGVAAPKDAAGWRGLALPGESPVRFVSISVFEPAAEVELFRGKDWPMPWLHAVAGPEAKAVMDSFSVGGVPTMFFVDAAGMVVQRDGELADGLRKLTEKRRRGAG